MFSFIYFKDDKLSCIKNTHIINNDIIILIDIYYN